MTCPICNAVIDENVSICPECGSPISVIESEDSQHPWVLVYTTNTELDADMFKANLESSGVPVQLISPSDSMFQFTVGELALVKIYVQAPYVQQAMDIIRAIETGKEQPADEAPEDTPQGI